MENEGQQTRFPEGIEGKLQRSADQSKKRNRESKMNGGKMQKGGSKETNLKRGGISQEGKTRGGAKKEKKKIRESKGVKIVRRCRLLGKPKGGGNVPPKCGGTGNGEHWLKRSPRCENGLKKQNLREGGGTTNKLDETEKKKQ